MGGHLSRVTTSRGPYVYRLYGQNHHRIGSLTPSPGEPPKFSQLYIYDTEHEDENRVSVTRPSKIPLDTSIVNDLRQMIDQHNPHAKWFRVARDRFANNQFADVRLRLISTRSTDGRIYNLPTCSEVAALIVGDIDSTVDNRDILLQSKAGPLQRIHELHASYLSLQYPLLFPYGEDGYRIDLPYSDKTQSKRGRVSIREYFQFRLQERLAEAITLRWSRRLFQQYVVDVYCMIESERLNYIRLNQKKLRADQYNNLQSAANSGNIGPSSAGKRIVLPSTFVGGPRYMFQNYQDAMALCQLYGYPDLFITFTCNTKWPEIIRFLKKGNLQPEDRPDIVCRVFKIKLDRMIRDFTVGKIFGTVQAVVYTIEFQKRGLPHAHILLFLDCADKIPDADGIDKIISVELPDPITQPDLYSLVIDRMLHGPCGPLKLTSPCMSNGKCIRHFPKRFNSHTSIDHDGYPIYRRLDNGRTVEKNGVSLDNRYVVPYNPTLLLKYQAHINVEWCNQSRAIKYLFKYINKGNDRISAAVMHNDSDEILAHYNCRYISPCEAAWRIFGFPIHYRSTVVERLSFLLPGEQHVVFSDNDPIDAVVNRRNIDKSMFLSWMECNSKFDCARDLTYSQFPSHFVWNAQEMEWRPRKRGFSIGRIYNAPPGSGERYYLRILLNHMKGPTSFEDIRTVNGTLYPTYKQACYALGLLDDDREYIDGITEASFWGSVHYLRSLFVVLLTSDCMARPEYVWEKTWAFLADDVLRTQRRRLLCDDLVLSDTQLQNFALAEVEKLLHRHSSSLSNYPSMPQLDGGLIYQSGNKLIQDELSYDVSQLQSENTRLVVGFTSEQKSVYDEILNAVSSNQGGVFFLYGYGGTGKTYIWRALSSSIRCKGEIVLTVASSGIAALLIPGGRTAHSRFVIPFHLHEDSTCHIKVGSDLAELISEAKLIIWDEAPMMHKFSFEALDRTLRDVLRDTNPQSLEQPFGGKVVVFGGDFRQILPVVPKGSRHDIVFSALNSSYLWDFCKVLRLTRNMRLHSGITNVDQQEAAEFSQWLLKVGDGEIGESVDGEVVIRIPDDLLLIDNIGDPIAAICQYVYPSIVQNHFSGDYFQDRAILAPTHDVVDKVNTYLLSQLSGDEKIYLSSDSMCRTEITSEGGDVVYSTDFLNSIRCSGVPNHSLALKVGVPVMLLRNLDQAAGLCNGTRLLTTRLGAHIIEGRIISGNNVGDIVYIPRMTLTPSDTKYPFKFQRRQFPLSICFAMTINKSHGQSLAHVGLYLPRPVFTHGQLYVALSRVTSKKGIKILITDGNVKVLDTTTNVVYNEVFDNV